MYPPHKYTHLSSFALSALFILITIFTYTLTVKTNSSITKYDLPFKKVVLWGHKLHSHTHSYIHWGFYKAFNHLEFETYWFDRYDNVDNFDFSQTLFITAGNADDNIPLRNDCLYILHNCTSLKYSFLHRKNQCIILQVYTHPCVKRNLVELAPLILCSLGQKTIYMPWATDLLPHEIDEIKNKMPFKKTPYAFFVGSYQGGQFSNVNEIEKFKKACSENNITFDMKRNVSPEENIDLIQNSLLAPALQGKWQCDQGYIPCRIFKNISYGALGITNSQIVYELFNKKIVYNPDTYKLCYDALNRLKTISIEELYEMMDFVRDNHTYINRIDTLLTFFERVYNSSHKNTEGEK